MGELAYQSGDIQVPPQQLSFALLSLYFLLIRLLNYHKLLSAFGTMRFTRTFCLKCLLQCLSRLFPLLKHKMA